MGGGAGHTTVVSPISFGKFRPICLEKFKQKVFFFYERIVLRADFLKIPNISIISYYRKVFTMGKTVKIHLISFYINWKCVVPSYPRYAMGT